MKLQINHSLSTPLISLPEKSGSLVIGALSGNLVSMNSCSLYVNHLLLLSLFGQSGRYAQTTPLNSIVARPSRIYTHRHALSPATPFMYDIPYASSAEHMPDTALQQKKYAMTRPISSGRYQA